MTKLDPEHDPDFEIDDDDEIIPDCYMCGKPATRVIKFDTAEKGFKGERFACADHVERGKIPPVGFYLTGISEVTHGTE